MMGARTESACISPKYAISVSDSFFGAFDDNLGFTFLAAFTWCINVYTFEVLADEEFLTK